MEHINIINWIMHFYNTHQALITGGLVIFLIICLEFHIIELLNKKFMFKYRHKINNLPIITFIPIFCQTLKFVIALVILTLFIKHLGYNITSLLAGAGIVGLAMAIAAQTTIGNLFGAFSILSDKIYQIGDYIKFDDKAGYITSINLRSTSLRTPEGFLINVPNNILSNIAITNVSHTTKYKIDIQVAIECDSTLEVVNEALAILQKIADEQETIEDTALAYIESLEDTAINLRLVGYTSYTKWADYTKQRSYMLGQIIDRFQKHNIALDIPDSRLTINQLLPMQ